MVRVIYRSPHSDVSHWRKTENNIQRILDLNIPVILGDDLNIDMLGNQCEHLGDILTSKFGECCVGANTYYPYISYMYRFIDYKQTKSYT